MPPSLGLLDGSIGRLHPAFDGVYSLGGPPQREREWWMAAVLTYGAGTKLSHSAAAELYGCLRYPLDEIHVTTLTERRPRHGILDCATTVQNERAYRRIVRQAQVDGLTSHVRLLAFAAPMPTTRAGRRT